MAEMSILSFCKIAGALHSSPILAEYRTHPGLQHRLGRSTRVNLSFGLHAGWAIEGAIGSDYKIDASYLSPNISVANSVEHVTQIYGVILVISEAVVTLCSARFTELCRRVDNAIIPGCSTPMELYSVDLDYESVPIDRSPPPVIQWPSGRNRYRARQFLSGQKAIKLREDFDMRACFDKDPTIRDMRKIFTREFLQIFNMGFLNYLQGEWLVAKRMLLETQKYTQQMGGSQDGPSTALLSYMQDFQFEAPKDWTGVRQMEL